MCERVIKCPKMCLSATTHDADQRQIDLFCVSFLIIVDITLG